MNCNQYVEENIPFVIGGRDRDGLDCWGLVALFYKEQLDIDLPDYGGIAAGLDTRKAIRTILEQKELNWEVVDEPRPGDVILARMKTHPIHVGIYNITAKGPSILHIESGQHVANESITGIKWKRRILGIFRLKS